MTIPPLPTDSLYKFIALFGLAVAVASFGILESRTHQVLILLTEARSQSASYEAWWESGADWRSTWRQAWTEYTGEEWKGDWVRVANLIEEKIRELEQRLAEPEAAAEATEDLERLRRLSRLVGLSPFTSGEVRERQQLIRSSLELVEVEAERLDRLTTMLVPAGVAGVSLSLAGFCLWYVRFQRHQDRLVRLQAESEERALAGQEAAPPPSTEAAD